MSRNRRNPPSTMAVTSEWGSLINRAEHISSDPDSKSIYQVEPVDLKTFVHSKDYLNQGMWGFSKEQEEFLEAATDFENDINFFVLMIGKGGGKNWSCGIVYLYAVYKLLCMYDPHGYLEHNSSKAITLLNVAINALQAKKNFFDPVSNILRSAGPKAFRDFGFDPDRDILTTQITFPKNIEILSANSKSGGTEGYDVLLGIADEVDDVEFYGVDKILDTLRSSSQSRFKGKEKIIAISYQRYTGSSGKIADLYSSAVGHSHIFARRHASWEFHPVLERSDFQTFFDENPEKAACIYGSVISGAFEDSWIKDSERIKRAMNWERKWIFDWELPYDPDPVGTTRWVSKLSHHEWKAVPDTEYSYRTPQGELKVLDPYNIPIRVPGDPNKIYTLCGDPALGSEKTGGDGYGLTMGHREIVKIDGVPYVRPVVDFSFRFTGSMFEEGQVQLSAVEALIQNLKERYGYNIKYFSFDGWNSIALTQWIAKTYNNVIVRDRNIVETKDYSALRDAIFGEAPPSSGKGAKMTTGGIDMPWHPILYEELRNLREDRSKKGGKVDHTSTSTKDIADTVAKFVYTVVYQWPFVETTLSGMSAGQDTPTVDHALLSRLKTDTASDDDKKVYYESIASDAVGLGTFKK